MVVATTKRFTMAPVSETEEYNAFDTPGNSADNTHLLIQSSLWAPQNMAKHSAPGIHAHTHTHTHAHTHAL